MKNDILWLWLSAAAGITRSKQHKLLHFMGDIESIYNSKAPDFKSLDFLSEQDITLLSNKDLSFAEKIKSHLISLDACVISIDNSDYPDLLRKIHIPPTVLYVRGSFRSFNSMPMLSMVGTRKATNYGRASAYNIARELSESGVAVVSGLAMGIDGKSHEGALAGPSPTIAVVGNGVDMVYPKLNKPLMDKIIRSGCVVSEYPPGTPPEKYHFPERNRIIAGMTKGTVVVEADIKSGSLITAKYATDENRDVFALPGNINNSSSKGTNYLLKDGAHLVTGTKDILDFYGIEKSQSPSLTKTDASSMSPQDKILCAIGNESVHIDTICQKTSLDAGSVNANLLILEMQGKVIKLAGAFYALNQNI